MIIRLEFILTVRFMRLLLKDGLLKYFILVTFVKVSLGSVNVLWKAGTAALILTVPQGLKIDHNDLGGQYHKNMTSIRLPQFSIRTLLDYSKSNTWLEAAEISADVFLDIYSSPVGWHEASAVQSEFVREQDRPTGRVERFIDMLKTARSKPGIYSFRMRTISGLISSYRWSYTPEWCLHATAHTATQESVFKTAS